MSAIWGIISRTKTDKASKFNKMTEIMKRYKIDRFDIEVQKDCYMGCGHQYFTEEAKYDVSPIYDDEGCIHFSADCFLYNRKELFSALSDSLLIPEETGDAKLAFLMFKKYGYDFVKQLRGSFSFAIYDERANKLHLITDHFCKRYLCYQISDDYIAFASCYKPILEAGEHRFKLSKRSIVNAYSTMTPLNFREPEITPFEEIFHLEAAMHFIIDVKGGSVEKEQYWTPRQSVKKLKGMSDNQYKDLFLNTYRKVCIDHLRSRGETGIMLSGGLDSASVLAMVAPELNKRGKKIYSYTTVPCPEFEARINYSVIEDESFLIREQQKFQPNLEPRFINSDNENCLVNIPKYQEIYDLPIKAVINGNNVFKMGEAAVADNCYILLGGGNGNANVSYGYISNHVGLCLHRLKFATAISEVRKYCKICGFSNKRMFKDFLKDIKAYLFDTANVGQYFISKENREKYGIAHLIREEKKELGSSFVTSEKQKRNFMFIPKQYIQKSLYYTVNSLEQGCLQLDPTLSVEMVELCMSLPNECFVKNGVERRLIRDYMKDLIPPIITDMRKGYGVQASDFYYRINRDWDQLKDDVMSILNDPLLFEYLDKAEIDELIGDIEASEHDFGWNTAWFTANICALGYFLRGHKQYL